MNVNGKKIKLTSITAQNVSEYLFSLGINSGTVAIEYNGEILDREKWDKTRLCPDDKMEIIKFVGGG